jgi:DNA-directed RNA polymerase specialized sigma24 family protein
MAADPSMRSDNPEDTSAGTGPSAARQKWTLTQVAFDRLLDSLGSDRDAAGTRYLEIRRNLVRLFEWRGCPTPDEYADETINRCARKIGEGEEIRDVGTYCIGIARMLVREMSRDRSQQTRPLEDAPEPRVQPAELEIDPDRRVQCLHRCLGQLSPETRNLILHYYQGDKGNKIKNRKSLTELFGIPASTLRMRALRVRERLQLCAETCVARGGAEA